MPFLYLIITLTHVPFHEQESYFWTKEAPIR